MARFSVIVPVYNVEKYLPECVESVLKQSFNDYELILVDDGSTDKCPEICEQYAKTNKQIKVVHKSNGGVSDSRNCGLKYSSGEYIIFLDADDAFSKECLNKIDYHIYKYGRVDIVFASFMLYDEKNNKHYKNNEDYCTEIVKKDSIGVLVSSIENNTMTWVVFASVFKRKMLVENNIMFENNIKTAEDLDYYLRAILRAKSFSSCNIDICNYRLNRDGSATTNPDKNSVYCTLSIYKKWFDYFLKNTLVLEHRKILCEYFSSAFISKISQLIIINKEDRGDVVKYIVANIEILRYSSGTKNKIKYYVMKIFGVERGVSLLNVYYKIKERVK